MDDKKIMPKDLIDLIVSTKPTAEVENDEDMYPSPQGEIEVDDERLCSLVVHPDLGSSLDMGNFRFEVGGIEITVGRDVDGPDDEYEFNELKDGSWVSRDDLATEDVIKAIKENVTFPEYDEMEYTDYNFDPDDVENSITVEDGSVFAEDEDENIYCYSGEDEVPEDQTVIESSDAVHKLVEKWSEDGGEANGEIMESFGPWSGSKGW